MIPKIIHYCWLSGDPFPDLINKCIDSWHNILSDYEFMLWDTRKIDVDSNLWLKQAYENKKYAFAADYIRFFALYHYGGIYLDADVEVLKDFKSLLIEKQLLGEEKGADWVKSCLDYYANRPFVKEDGSFDTKPVPLLLNRIIQEKAFDIKPYYYFSPKDYNIGKIDISDSTFCIHHFDGKWIKRGLKYSLKRNMHKILYYAFGRKGHNCLVRAIRKLK